MLVLGYRRFDVLRLDLTRRRSARNLVSFDEHVADGLEACRQPLLVLGEARTVFNYPRDSVTPERKQVAKPHVAADKA
jgi:hypothetical protein